MTTTTDFAIISLAVADVAHLVERHLAKVEVASSSLVIRSKKSLCRKTKAFYFVPTPTEYKTPWQRRFASPTAGIDVPRNAEDSVPYSRI